MNYKNNLILALTTLCLGTPILYAQTEEHAEIKMGHMAPQCTAPCTTTIPGSYQYTSSKPQACVNDCTLDLRNRCIESLCPFPLFYGNPSTVKTLLLSKNKICVVPERTFCNFCSLQQLDLSCNAIISLEWGAFECLNKLCQLNLSSNKLCKLEKGDFVGLCNLKGLNLCKNVIKKIKPEAWKGLKKLKVLIISNNKLEILCNGIFAGLNKLKKLDLSNNCIKDVEPNAFECLQKVEVICLNNNKLTYLSSEPFINLPNLCVLKVGNNKLCQSNLDQLRADLPGVDVQGKAYTGGDCTPCDPTIEIIEGVLDLSNQNLKCLDILNKVCNPQDATSLILDYNQLTKIPDQSFQKFVNLTELSINFNKINKICSNALAGLSALQTFSCNNNQLCELPNSLFCPTPNLQFADFSVNKIKSVCSKFFNCTHNLQEINFTSNPIDSATKQLFQKIETQTGIVILYDGKP